MAGFPAYPELVATIARQGITQQALADATGVTVGTISNICRGITRPSMALRQRLADALGRGGDVEELFALHPGIERLIQTAIEQGFARNVDDPGALRKIARLVGPTATERRTRQRPPAGRAPVTTLGPDLSRHDDTSG